MTSTPAAAAQVNFEILKKGIFLQNDEKYLRCVRYALKSIVLKGSLIKKTTVKLCFNLLKL